MILTDFGNGGGPFGAAPKKSAAQTMSELEKKLKAKGFDVTRTGPGATPAKKPPVAPPRTRPVAKRPPPKPVPSRAAPKPVAKALKPAPKPVVKIVKSAGVLKLQRALVALGKRVGDSTLTRVATDGLIGPATTAALNLALRKYAQPGPQAPAPMRAGTLTPGQVLADVDALAAFIELETSRKAPGKAAPVAKAGYNIGVAKLQSSVNTLSQRVRDSALALKIDGLIGPKTAAAVNRALSKYASSAPVAARTGKLPALAIAQNAVDLADYVDAAARGGAVTPVAKAGASPGVLRLQNALRQLGAAVKDSALVIVADGLTGPKTATATNRAMKMYVTGAPASFKQTMTPAGVASSATNLATLVENEVTRRRSAPVGKRPPTKRPPSTTTAPTEEDTEEDAAAADEKLPVIHIPVDEDIRPDVPVAPTIRPEPGAPTPVGPDDVLEPSFEPTEEKKPFPTAWVLGGVAGVAVLGTVIYVASRGGKGRRNRRR